MNGFPIPVPDPLPTRIHPCPIIEVAVELQFVTEMAWDVLPGLLFSHIRERYPVEQSLPLSQIPETIRASIRGLTYSPLVCFQKADFNLQLGPRVLTLVAQQPYPGWGHIKREIEWLVDRIRQADFISGCERLGMRYVDFFKQDIFPKLKLDIRVGEQAVSGGGMSFSKELKRGSLSARLRISNQAVVMLGNERQAGSVLDVDVWSGPSQLDISEGLIDVLCQAHLLQKELFFGLLKDDFLSSFNPEYES